MTGIYKPNKPFPLPKVACGQFPLTETENTGDWHTAWHHGVVPRLSMRKAGGRSGCTVPCGLLWGYRLHQIPRGTASPGMLLPCLISHVLLCCMRGSERKEAERQTKEEMLAQCELLQSCSSRDTASGRTLEGAGAILAPAGNIRSDIRLENYFSRKKNHPVSETLNSPWYC